MGTTLTYELWKTGLVVLAIQGNLDAAGVDQIREQFAGAISHYSGPVIVDLSGVEYLASAGLALLVSKGKTQRGRGGDLVVVANTPRVIAVFELTGFGGLFSVYDTLEVALEGVEKTFPGQLGSTDSTD
jgi:anti-sigma B factor antagonist